MAAVVLVVSGLAIKSLGDANDRFASNAHGIDARALLAANIRSAVDRRAIAARNLVLVTKPSNPEIEKAETARSRAE